MAALTEYYDIPPGYMEIREFPPPPPRGIQNGDPVQIMTTNDFEEYSKKIKSMERNKISNGPFTEATFSKNNSQKKGHHGQMFPDYEVRVFTDTAQQTTLNQLTDGKPTVSSFYFVIPPDPEEISKVTFTFVKGPYLEKN